MLQALKQRRYRIPLEILLIAIFGLAIIGAHVKADQKTTNEQKVLKVRADEKKKKAQSQKSSAKASEASSSSSSEAAASSSSEATTNDSQNANQAATQSATTNAPAASNATSSANTAATAIPAANTRTDGMNFAGQHFDIAGFSGVNGESTPRWTPYIFQWSALSNYYLAEAASAAGQAVKTLSIGSPIVLNGRTLHVTKILPSMDRLSSSNLVFSLASQHAIGIQTCVNNTGSIVATYWAD